MREIFSEYLSKVIEMRQAQIRYLDARNDYERAKFFKQKTELQKEVDRMNNHLIGYLALETICAVL